MRNRDRSRITLADRERRTRHQGRDPERPAGAPDERRLPRSELALHKHHVAGAQPRGQLRAKRFGLLWGPRPATACHRRSPMYSVPSLGHERLPRARAARSDCRLYAGVSSPSWQAVTGSDTAKAAGLAGAMIANNVIALGSTVVFARELTDYGSLGALISYLLILTVAGQAMQVATAREGVLGHLGLGRRVDRDAQELDPDAARGKRRADGGLDPPPPSDRPGGRGQALPVGGGSRHPNRLPVPRGLAPTRRASGRRRLPQRRAQPGLRAGRRDWSRAQSSRPASG